MACRIVTGKQNPLTCILPSTWLQKGLKTTLTMWENQLRGGDIPPCLDSLGLERPKNTHTIQPGFTVHHPGRQKTKKNWVFSKKNLIKICSKVIGYVLGSKVHKRKCKHIFFHLISKTAVCCSSLPLKVMEKGLKLPVSIPQARGSCLGKQDISTQRAARAGTGGQEKARLHTVRDIQQLHPL